VEFVIEQVASLKVVPALMEIESMDVISFLRSTPEEVALICRIKFKNPDRKVEDVFANDFGEIQVLEQGREGYICYFRSRRRSVAMEADPLGPGVYLSPPYEIHDGRLRATFLANAGDIRRVLRLFSKSKISYKVISLMDAKFLPDSPLGQLTGRQRDVIVAAFKNGYYDVPRKVSSEELARQLEIREPTLVMHRRKAERKLLSSVIGES